MAAELIFAEEAEQDINDAYAYYEMQRVRLAFDGTYSPESACGLLTMEDIR